MEILPSFIQEAIRNEPHQPTKYHRETLYEHLIRCAENCKRLAPQFDIPEDLAYNIGLLHDIGKPFTRCQYKKNVLYLGHAQIGAYLISRLPINNKDVLTFTTNNHMCCCSHQKGLDTLTQFKSLLQITLPESNRELCIRSLALLFTADLLSRDCDNPNNEEEVIKYSQDFIRRMQIDNNTDIIRKICIQKKSSNDKVVILPLGTSGCGKSTFSKTIPNATIIERDQCYYQVAAENGFSVGNYQETYKFVGELESGKELVQKLFLKRIADALEDSEVKVVIIDTMQTLFGHAWKGTIEKLPEDAKAAYSSALKIGVYLFPQNEFGISFEPKTGQYSKYPDQKINFPKINLETGIWDPMEIDIGIGNTSLVDVIVNRFLKEVIVPSVPEQGPALKMGFTPYQIVNEFPPGIVNTTTEFENQYWKIVTLNYLDGYQIFTGPTRDYRGESFALNKETNEWNLIRGSLPVFPDFDRIEKDPACYPYLEDVLSFRPEWKKHITFKKDFKLIITPKYDGSLFNLTFIPDPEFSGVYCERRCKYGKLFFGSKGRFMAKDPVKTRINNAVIASYGSIEEFVTLIDSFLEKNQLQNKRVTFHFEAIDAIPTPELTVFYGKAWCPFIGYTVFDNLNKKFILPEPTDFITQINQFNDWKEVMEYFETNYQKLIEGDEIIEPEGYVLHIQDGDIWLPIKLKYEFYYIAHKPDSKNNREKAKVIAEDPKFELLRKRLAKFRERAPIESLISSQIQEFINGMTINSQECEKKEWAVHWNKRKNELDLFGEMIEKIVIEHHEYLKDKIKNKIFNVLMKMHGEEITVNTFVKYLL